MRRFTPLHPSALDVLEYDFAPILPAGVLLTGTPVATVTVEFGTDPTPQPLVSGTLELDDTATKVLVPVDGKLDGVDYLVTVECATTDAAIRVVLPAIVPVRRKY